MCLLMRNFFCVENTLIFETCLCKLSSSYNIFIVIFSIRILFFVARNFNYKKIGSSFKLICDLPFKLKFCTQHNILIFWLVVGMTFCWYNLGKQKCILQANCFMHLPYVKIKEKQVLRKQLGAKCLQSS